MNSTSSFLPPAPPLNGTHVSGDGFGVKDILLSILIPLILDGIMIGCTILVWKYGPLDGNPTWPADFGIFFQCFILFIVSLIHFFAWGNIVMMNTPILLACAIGGFILQLIELILRKCEKDGSPHWSRFFAIISFIVVALLIAAIGVWIAGLVQLRSNKNSSNPGEIWGMLVLFFGMVFLFIAVAASFVIKTIPHLKNFRK